MNFLNSLFENIPHLVNAHQCSIQSKKKFKFITFILYHALEGKSNFSTYLSIPQEIIITIMSFTFKQKIFLHRPVFMKIQQRQIRSNQRVIFGNFSANIENSSIKDKQQAFSNDNFSNIVNYGFNELQGKNSKKFYEINVIKTWVVKTKEEEKSQNQIFKRWQHLNNFLKSVNIQAFNTKCNQNHQKEYQRNTNGKLQCQLICQNQNLFLHQVQCLKAYAMSKIVNSTDISNIVNLINKNMIIFTLTCLDSNSKQSLNFLIIHDQKRSVKNGDKNNRSSQQNNKNINQNFDLTHLNQGGLNLDELPVIFNEQKEVWETNNSFDRFCRTKEINQQNCSFICQSGKQYNLNGYELIEIE